MASPLHLLIDVNVGQAVVDWLRGQGHEVLYARDLDARMTDERVLAIAVEENRLVVTMDADFGELVHRSGQHHAGVLLLRAPQATGAEKIAIIQWILEHYTEQLHGAFSVYKSGRLRIRSR